MPTTTRALHSAGPSAPTYCATLTVVSSSVADSQICQVVQESLELKGRQCRFKSLLLVQPERQEARKPVKHFQNLYVPPSAPDAQENIK